MKTYNGLIPKNALELKTTNKIKKAAVSVGDKVKTCRSPYRGYTNGATNTLFKAKKGYILQLFKNFAIVEIHKRGHKIYCEAFQYEELRKNETN